MPTAPSAPPSAIGISVVPNRITGAATYSADADTYMSEVNPMVNSQNTLADWEFSTAGEVYTNAQEAFASATNAANSEGVALSLTNYKGDWSTLTGTLNTPASVFHDGAFWILETNLADVTASEPSPTNTDWTYYSGNRWLSYTASFTANANSINHVLATGSAVNITQPTFSANDFIVIANSVDSTQTVKYLNPSNTIKGKSGTASAGDNVILAPGDVMHLYARTATILEEV